MTTERDVELLLERWLVEGVDEMPDRVYRSTLDRVDRQPQQRAWRVSWRHSTVNTYLKPILAVAAVLILAIGGIAIVARPSGSAIGGPRSPSPALSPLPLPSGPLESRDYVARASDGDPMAFTITAPAGWIGFGGFFLGGPHASGGPDGIGLAFMHNPQVVSAPCDASVRTSSAAPRPARVDDLVAALSARTDLGVSGVTDAQLAGYSGKRLDLQLPATSTCGEYYVFGEPQGLYSNGPSNHWRVWLLDVDGATAVVVLLDYAATPAADRAAAQAVLDSLRITP